jgi:uncharacterized cupredoxin-like copper-binding protein
MGRRMERLTGAAVILIALGMPAVAAADAAAQKITVVASEYRFSPNKLSFKRGVLYRLHIDNRGKEMHEFTAPEFFKTVILRNPEALNPDRTEAEIPPGAAKDLFFVPQQPGRYSLRCSDHDWAGMTGEITVK